MMGASRKWLGRLPSSALLLQQLLLERGNAGFRGLELPPQKANTLERRSRLLNERLVRRDFESQLIHFDGPSGLMGHFALFGSLRSFAHCFQFVLKGFGIPNFSHWRPSAPHTREQPVDAGNPAGRSIPLFQHSTYGCT